MSAAKQREELFVRAYCAGASGAAAARAAGFSAKGAHVAGVRMLRKATVRARIDAINLTEARACGLTRELVMHQAANLVRGDIGDAYAADSRPLGIKEMSRETRALVVAVETEEVFEGKGEERCFVGVRTRIKFRDPIRAAELGARLTGLDKGTPAAEGSVLHITIVPHGTQQRAPRGPWSRPA